MSAILVLGWVSVVAACGGDDEGDPGPADGGGIQDVTRADGRVNDAAAQDAPRETGGSDLTDAVALANCALFANADKPIEKLTATGCVDPANPKNPAAFMIPYEVNSPLWSDGADKARFMSIPDGTKIHVIDCATETTACSTDPFTGVDGHWNYPVGTVMMKIFSFEGTTIETRLLMNYGDGRWLGYSYQWNQEQTEALVLPDARRQSTFLVGASRRSQEWNYPSRADCTMCHTAYAGDTLGTETAQLNRMEASENQLDRLERLGILDAALRRLPPLPIPTGPGGTLEDRARSYLHANCSFCHRPDGPLVAPDFRFTSPFDFKKMGVCDVPPSKGDVGAGGNARLLVPEHPEYSVIALRMKDLDLARMPQLASYRVDTLGVKAIEDWISSVTACP